MRSRWPSTTTWLLRPGGVEDRVDEVDRLEAGDVTSEYVGLDVAERGQRAVLDAVGEGLEDLVLEVRARVRSHDLGAGLGGGLVEGDSEYVGLDAGGDERDLGAQVVRHLRRGVQRDRGPDHLGVRVR